MSRKLIAVIVLCLLGQAAPAAAQADIFWVSPPVIEVDEGVGSVFVEIAVGGVSEGAINAMVGVAGGSTATTGVDFTGGAAAVNWHPGLSSAVTLEVVIIDDGDLEGQESILIEIYDSSGAPITGHSTVQININDNDAVVDLPTVLLYGNLTSIIQVRDLFCYDEQNQIYSCGQGLTVEYPATTPKSFRLSVSPIPELGETVPVYLESWGGITLNSNVVDMDHTGPIYVDFNVPGDGPTPFGGVRVLPNAGYAPPGTNDFHEMKISVDATENWSPVNCAGCFIAAQISNNSSDCGGGSCGETTDCEDVGVPVKRGGDKSATSDLDLLRRYRDELLAGSSNGQAIIDLYGAMGGGVVKAFFADPTLGQAYVDTRNSWMPALDDLLDGTGFMEITPGMQEDLTVFLDKVAAAATGDLVTQLADLRLAGGLDSLTGVPISSAHTGFTSGGATPIEETSWGNLKAQYR